MYWTNFQKPPLEPQGSSAAGLIWRAAYIFTQYLNLCELVAMGKSVSTFLAPLPGTHLAWGWNDSTSLCLITKFCIWFHV